MKKITKCRRENCKEKLSGYLIRNDHIDADYVYPACNQCAENLQYDSKHLRFITISEFKLFCIISNKDIYISTGYI